MPDLIQTALEQARLRLLDLSNRNRLVNYRESARCIAIVDELPREVCSRLYEDRPFRFVAYDGPRENTPASELPLPIRQGATNPAKYTDGELQTPYTTKELKNRLRKLVNDGRTILEESGANSIFLVIGFLRYRDSEDSQVWQRAPLILIPVSIERAFGGWEPNAFSLRVLDEELDTNRSLLHKLESLSVRLPDIDKAWTKATAHEESSFDPERYLNAVAHSLRSPVTKEWRVERQMAVGVFRFQKQAMWHDLDPARWPAASPVTGHPLVRRILLGPQTDSQPPGALADIEHSDSAEVDGHTNILPLILNADSSQVQALHHALRATQGLVIEGPPGTGKSQTIANLIAAAIASGQTVLFVAEKLAALQVVADRLAHMGLDSFCQEMHGLSSNRKTFYERLQKRLAMPRPASPTSLAEHKAELARRRTELLDLSRLMSTPLGPLGLPAHEVVWRIESLRHRLPATLELHRLQVSTNDRPWFLEHKQLADEYAIEWHSLLPHAIESWKGFMPRTYADRQRVALASRLDDTRAAMQEVLERAAAESLTEALGSSPQLLQVLGWGRQEPVDRIPQLPDGVSSEDVQAALSVGSLDQADAFLRGCDDFLQLREKLGRVVDLESPALADDVKLALAHITRIAGVCDTPKATLNECDCLAESHQRLRVALKHMASSATLLSELLAETPRRLEEYRALAERAAQIIDAPAGFGVYACPAHCHPRTHDILSKAQERARVVIAGLTASTILDPVRVEDTGALRVAIEEVASRVDAWLPWLSSSYRQARKYLTARKLPSARVTRRPECLSALRHCYDACVARDRFRDDPEFRESLGSVFEGVATDWARAGLLVQHATAVRTLVGQEKARSLLAQWADRESIIADAIARVHSSLAAVKTFREAHSAYPDMLWHRPLRDVEEVLSKHEGDLKDAASFFKSDGHSIGTHLTFRESMEVLGDRFARYQRLAAELGSNPLLPQVTKASNAEDLRSVAGVTGAIIWLRRVANGSGVCEAMLSWLCASDHKESQKRNALLTQLGKKARATIDQLVAALRSVGELLPSYFFGKDPNVEAVRDKVVACREYLDALPGLQRVSHLGSRLSEANLKAIPEAVSQGLLKDKAAGEWLDLVVHADAYESFVESHPRLGMQSNTSYEMARSSVAQADKALFRLTSEHIAAVVAAKPCPQGNASGAVGTFSQLGLLRHQTALKKRHLPVRQLITRAGDALKALKPCFLMSPLSVAQYLPPGRIQFDLVVMDEASQIRPEDAIGAIARASKCVIVGDPKQLPPTSFFDTDNAQDGDDADEHTAIVNTESILDVCLTQLPMRRLTWHYRSEHERLIQFSNEQFYDGELKVFPSPKRRSDTHGVRGALVQSPSYRKGGYNRGEAELVVRKALDHLRHSVGKSLGIVAMNKRQAEEIEFLLEAEIRKDALLEQRLRDLQPPLFVKNLENVQGDERDIIIISTTYGPAAAGQKTAQRFGPINSAVGHRRLNVVATRAKQLVEVVSSIRPQDILIGPTSSIGVRSLRDYLSYVFSGDVPDTGMSSGRGAESPFEQAVAYHIRCLGYDCEPQIGVAGFFVDIGIRHPSRPGEFVLGVECDGATYHSTRSIRERDRLRQEILESKGWVIHRIWSTSWFCDRETEIQRLKKAIADALASDASRGTGRTDVTGDDENAPTAHDSEAEAIEKDELLWEALERYWHEEIAPTYPNRQSSVLSELMISRLVEHRPRNLQEFHETISAAERNACDPKQARFLDDIFGIVGEYL
jgi:very-short-patch-repair endonuclease